VQEDAGTQSFDDVYNTYAERVLNLAYRFTANDETARDLTQEIFIKIYENLDSFEQRSQIYTWIHRIAVNHITNHLKKERRRRWVNLLDRTVSDVVHEEGVDPTYEDRIASQPSDKKIEARERAQIVWAAVRSLPIKYRVPLVLYQYEGFSYNEISESMGLSLSAVESRIHRAKKQLIKKLEPWVGQI
jgi:RNA polymerase sigma-70 factor (ECF subfamily)